MKKHACLLIAVACAFALVAAFALVGCSSGTTEAGNSAASQSEQKAADEPGTEETTANATNEGSSTENEEPVELQIFAANSLSKAMDEVQALYTQDHPWVTFADTQYEASGTLNEMLGAGSYADVLITASKATMDTAVEEGYVDEATRFDMFTNDLVIVGGESADLGEITLEDLASGEYTLAVGDANVPAGNYAKQSLSTTDPQAWIPGGDDAGKTGKDVSGKEGTFEGTPLEGKVTEGSSVGNVCSYANSGDVDCAMVYTSDVYRFGGVKILSTVPNDTHKAIVYPAAICADSEHVDAAEQFLDWAFNDVQAQQIWQEWGFDLA